MIESLPVEDSSGYNGETPGEGCWICGSDIFPHVEGNKVQAQPRGLPLLDIL